MAGRSRRGSAKDALLEMAQAPAGEREVRVAYEEPIEEPAGLRKATVRLAQKARTQPPERPASNPSR